MWTLGIPASEKVVRTVVVYAGLAVLLRLAGKRDVAQLNSFDLVVMLLLSNVVQNAIIGNDLSLTGGLLGAGVLIGFNAIVVRLSLASSGLAGLIEGRRTVLARRGVWDDKALRKEGLRRADVDAALRRQNANGVADVEEVALEPGGAVVATLVPELQSATKADVAAIEDDLRRHTRGHLERVEAKLDELIARLAT
jgi:uncharacterized membrane protein YcaP (DUF421 family)